MTPESLKQCWDTLMEVADQYESLSDAWRELVSARRLIEVEMRQQYGDEVWEQLTGREHDDLEASE